MKYTLKKVRKLKIWVTEVVCNLLMNNLTTNQFQQLIASVTEEHTACAVSWPLVHCLHNLFTTSLEKRLSWLLADCKRLSCSNATLQFYSSIVVHFFFKFTLFLSKQYNIYSSVSVSRQTLMFRLIESSPNSLFPHFLFCFLPPNPLLGQCVKKGSRVHFTLVLRG